MRSEARSTECTPPFSCCKRRLTNKNNAVDETDVATLQDLGSEINRLRSLLESFHSLARPHQLELSPVDVATMTAEVLAIQEAEYTKRGIRLVQDFAPDLPRLNADSRKLKQALLNLCNNAVEAMPYGGVLTVRGCVSGKNDVLLEVSDTGTGILESKERFEIFSTSKPHGSGFGLPVVQQIVSAHGGTVTLTSEPGIGTTARIILPLGESGEPRSVEEIMPDRDR